MLDHVSALTDLCQARGLTPQQTGFTVRFLAIERNAAKAYREAYKVKAGVAARWVLWESTQMLRHPKIAPVIAEWRDKIEPTIAQAVVDITAVNRASILNELKHIGYARLMHFGRIDEDGQFLVDLSGASEDQLAALQEVKVEETIAADGKVTRRTWIKLGNKRQALELMGREIGMFPLQHKVEVEDVSPPEVRAERAKQRQEALVWLKEMSAGRHLPAPAGGPIIDQEAAPSLSTGEGGAQPAPAKPNGKGNGHG